MPWKPETVRRAELVEAIDTAERRITDMVGRWSDSIPAPVRVELHGIETPLLRLLIRLGLRP
jgi:hypothetical protein